MSKLKILACQIEIPPFITATERDQHLNKITQKLRRQLANNPHDLIILPELSSVDYSRASFDNLCEIAETIHGSSFEIFSSLAQELGVAIVYGIPRIYEDHFHGSQVAGDEEGALIGYYDKLHLAQYGVSMEKEYFERGDHLFVFNVKGVTIAPIICYDIRFPELTRTLVVDHDVQLVLHCGAYARDKSFYSWHHFSVARALENQVFFLSLNRAGQNYGNSLFCTPWIDEITPETPFPQEDEIFQSLNIDTALISHVRKKYTFLADRLENYVNLHLIVDQ